MALQQGLEAGKLGLILETAPLLRLAAEKLRVILEMALQQGLEAGKLGLILETAPLLRLAAEKLRVVLEMAPVQGLGAEKWEMTGLCQVKRPAVVRTSPRRCFHSLR